MKITIYDLLGMIRKGNQPYKIMYEGRTYKFNEETKDYIFEDMEDMENTKVANLIGWLFFTYQIDYALNEKVSIPIVESKEDMIFKLEYWVDIKSWAKDNLEKGLEEQSYFNENIYYKINRLIDEVNKLKEK